MRRIANSDVLENNFAVVRRPPGWRVDGPRRLLLEMQKFDNPLNRHEVHLKLTVLFAECMRGIDDFLVSIAPEQKAEGLRD